MVIMKRLFSAGAFAAGTKLHLPCWNLQYEPEHEPDPGTRRESPSRATIADECRKYINSSDEFADLKRRVLTEVQSEVSRRLISTVKYEMITQEVSRKAHEKAMEELKDFGLASKGPRKAFDEKRSSGDPEGVLFVHHVER